jgi:Uma2 family endonuclease
VSWLEPQDSPHYTAVGLVEDALRLAFGAGWLVRSQGPVALDDESEPEPDVAVVPGAPAGLWAGTSGAAGAGRRGGGLQLSLDRTEKGGLYARAGLTDYWILNLRARVLEVYREPVPDAAATYGWRYSSARTLRPGAAGAPLAAPHAAVRVEDLLP